MKLTSHEIDLLTAIRTDDFHDGRNPVGNAVWSSGLNTKMLARSIAGVMSSLVQKNLVLCEGSGKEATMTLLQAGADALDDASKPVHDTGTGTVFRPGSLLAAAFEPAKPAAELSPARKAWITRRAKQAQGYVPESEEARAIRISGGHAFAAAQRAKGGRESNHNTEAHLEGR